MEETKKFLESDEFKNLEYLYLLRLKQHFINATPNKKISNSNYKMFTDYQNKEHERKMFLIDRKIEDAKMRAAKHKIKIERIL